MRPMCLHILAQKIESYKSSTLAVAHYLCRYTFVCFCLFYLYIYPPDSQESDEGANT